MIDAVSVGPLVTGQPVSSAVPSLTGTVGVGQTLTASSGTWNPAATSYAYQWQRSRNDGVTWSNIGGATASTYTRAVADQNAVVRALVTATNAFAKAIAKSAATGPVKSSPAVKTSPPVKTRPPAKTRHRRQARRLGRGAPQRNRRGHGSRRCGTCRQRRSAGRNYHR